MQAAFFLQHEHIMPYEQAIGYLKEEITKNVLPVCCVIEDGVKSGGMGEKIASIVAKEGISTKLCLCAFPDKPVVQGSIDELDREYGLDAEAIASKINSLSGKDE